MAMLTTTEEPPPLVLRFKTGELVHDLPSLNSDKENFKEEQN